MCLERTPSWSIEFQRECLNHAIADPATGPDQKRAAPGPQLRLALPRLASHHATLPLPLPLPLPPPLHRSPHGWSISPGPATIADYRGTTLTETWLVGGSPPGRHLLIKLPKLALVLFDSSSPGSRPPCGLRALGCRSRLPRVSISSRTLVSPHGEGSQRRHCFVLQREA